VVNLAAKTAVISNIPYSAPPTLYTNTFTVSASNIVGTGPDSDPSNSIYLLYGTLHNNGYLDYQTTSQDPFDSGNNLRPKLEVDTLTLTGPTVDKYAKSNNPFGEREEYVTPYDNYKGGFKLGNNTYIDDQLAVPEDACDGIKSLKVKQEEYSTPKDNLFDAAKIVNKEIQESPTTFDKVNAGLHVFSEQEDDLLSPLEYNDLKLKISVSFLEQMPEPQDGIEWEYISGLHYGIYRRNQEEYPHPDDACDCRYSIGAKAKGAEAPTLSDGCLTALPYNDKIKEYVSGPADGYIGGHHVMAEYIDSETQPILQDGNDAGFGYFAEQHDDNDTIFTDSETSFRYYGTTGFEKNLEGPLDKWANNISYVIGFKDDGPICYEDQKAGIIWGVNQEDYATASAEGTSEKIGSLVYGEELDYNSAWQDTKDPIQFWVPASQPWLASSGISSVNRTTVTLPPEMLKGDVLILVFIHYNSSIDAAGYTKLGTRQLLDWGDGAFSYADIYWKRATGLESPLPIEVNDVGTFAQIYAFRDCNPENPPIEQFQMGDGSTLSFTSSIDSTEPIYIGITSTLGDYGPLISVADPLYFPVSGVNLFNLGVGVNVEIWEGYQPQAGSILSGTSSPTGGGCVNALFNFIAIPGYWTNVSTAAIITTGEINEEKNVIAFDDYTFDYKSGHGGYVYNRALEETITLQDQPLFHDEMFLIDPYKYAEESDMCDVTPSDDSRAGKYVLVESDQGDVIDLDYKFTTVQFLLLGQKEDKISAPKDKCDCHISVNSDKSESITTNVAPFFVGNGPPAVISKPALNNGRTPNLSITPWAAILPRDFLLATVHASDVPPASAYAANAAVAVAAATAANDVAVAAAAAAAAAPSDVNLAAIAVSTAAAASKAATTSAIASSVATDAADPAGAAMRAATNAAATAATAARTAANAATAAANAAAAIVAAAAALEAVDPGAALRAAEATAAAASAYVLDTIAAAISATSDAAIAISNARNAAATAANAAAAAANIATIAATSASNASNSLINAAAAMVAAALGNANLIAANSAARTAATSTSTAAVAANTRSLAAANALTAAGAAEAAASIATIAINDAAASPYDQDLANAAASAASAAASATVVAATAAAQNHAAFVTAIIPASSRADAATTIANNASSASDAVASIAVASPLNIHIVAASNAVNAAAIAASTYASDAADDAVAITNASLAADAAEIATSDAASVTTPIATAGFINSQAVLNAISTAAAADPAAVIAHASRASTAADIALAAAAAATTAADAADAAAIATAAATTPTAAATAADATATATATAADATATASGNAGLVVFTTEDSNLVTTAKTSAGYADSAATAAFRAADRATATALDPSVIAAARATTAIAAAAAAPDDQNLAHAATVAIANAAANPPKGIVFHSDWTVLPVCGPMHAFWKITTGAEPPVIIPSVQNHVVMGSITAYRGVDVAYADPITDIGPSMSDTKKGPTSGYGGQTYDGSTPYVPGEQQYPIYIYYPKLVPLQTLSYQLPSPSPKGPHERMIAITGYNLNGGGSGFYPSTTKDPDPKTHILPGLMPYTRNVLSGNGPTIPYTYNDVLQVINGSGSTISKTNQVGTGWGTYIFDGDTINEGPSEAPLPVLQVYAPTRTTFYGFVISLRGSFISNTENAGVNMNRVSDDPNYVTSLDNYEVEVRPTRAAQKGPIDPPDVESERLWMPGGPCKERDVKGPIDYCDYEYVPANMLVSYDDRLLTAKPSDACKSLLRSANKYSDSEYSAKPMDEGIGGTSLYGIDSSTDEYTAPSDEYGAPQEGEQKYDIGVPVDDCGGGVQGPKGPRNIVEYLGGMEAEEPGIKSNNYQEEDLYPSEESDVDVKWGYRAVNVGERARPLDYYLEANKIGRDIPTDSVEVLGWEDAVVIKSP
jgi:hypothetical protein